MNKFLDIHSHLDYPEYQSDFESIIYKMRELDIGTITIGTDFASAERAVDLANKYENIWACIGIHPADNHKEKWNEEGFEKLVQNNKVVAIGECGLDFFRLPVNQNTIEPDAQEIIFEKERQQELFEKQIEFAIKYDKPLMIHCRDAYKEVYDTLVRYKVGDLSQKSFNGNKGSNLKIHLHFFAGDIEVAKKFLELDATFSFTGVITFTNQYDEVIKFLPLEKIMSETDSPFVAPVPYRGRRNEPSYVIEVIKKLAELKKISFEQMNECLIKNTLRVFTLKQ